MNIALNNEKLVEHNEMKIAFPKTLVFKLIGMLVFLSLLYLSVDLI